MKKIVTFLLLTLAYTVNAQEISGSNLKKKWYLKNYCINGKNYSVPKKEKGDYINFNNNMVFESLSEGKKDNGTWFINTNGKYVIMKGNDNKKIKAFIKKLTASKLELEFDIDEIKGLIAVYSTKKD